MPQEAEEAAIWMNALLTCNEKCTHWKSFLIFRLLAGPFLPSSFFSRGRETGSETTFYCQGKHEKCVLAFFYFSQKSETSWKKGQKAKGSGNPQYHTKITKKGDHNVIFFRVLRDTLFKYFFLNWIKKFLNTRNLLHAKLLHVKQACGM